MRRRTRARQVAFDPAGRHLRHPAVSPNGRLVATTAYVYKSDDMDIAIERPGAIALFNARTAALVGDLTSGGKARRVLRRARQPAWSR